MLLIHGNASSGLNISRHYCELLSLVTKLMKKRCVLFLCAKGNSSVRNQLPILMGIRKENVGVF